MASKIVYTKRQLTQRVRKHMAQGYPNDAFAVSTNEIMLYIDQSLAVQIKMSAYENAKVDGVLTISESFLVTFQLSLVRDDNTGNYKITLPAPPLSLPLGYSVTDVYFIDPSNGKSQSALPIENKRVPYRKYLPSPGGLRYWTEGKTLWLVASDSQLLDGLVPYVQMPYARTDDLDADMNLPDDVIENIFNSVVMQLTKRLANPKDIVRDDLPAGNTNVTPSQVSIR